jgi:spermidine dehydrogenase
LGIADVSAVYLYRWGHSMVYPKPGWPFSAPINKNGQAIRVPSARYYARQQIGRISFGAQDVESSPANESAIGAGVRTSAEVLPLL